MDFLHKLMARGNGSSHGEVTGNLERLLQSVQDERETLQSLIASAGTCANDLPQVSASIDEVVRRAASLAQQLDGLAARVDGIDRTCRTFESLEIRTGTIEAGIRNAEERVRKALSRESEIIAHREAMQQVVALVPDTLARIDALKEERRALTELEEQLPRLREEFQALLDQQQSLKAELGQTRSGIASLAQDTDSSREAALKARAHATKAEQLVADVERRLEPVSQLRTLTQETDEQLRTLNALAEHVTSKAKALENQQQVVEHALVESRRVNEMVWDMELQIKKLNDGSDLARLAEENLNRIERLQRDSATQFEEATKGREAFARAVEGHERDAQALIEQVRQHLDRLALDEAQVGTLNERVRALQADVGAAEARMSLLSAQDARLTEVGERTEALTERVRQVSAQAEELQRRQATLNSLEERLDTLDAMSKRTDWQFESLSQSRQDLDALRKEIRTFYTAFEQTSALLEKLGQDKQDFERFVDKASAFAERASEIDAKIDDLTGRVSEAEAGAARTTGMLATVDAVATRLAEITPRVEIVDQLESRLNSLDSVSADVDRRLRDQLARRTELEELKVIAEGVATHVTDAQQKLATVNSSQARLMSAMDQVSGLEAELEKTGTALRAIQRDEASLAAQERRLTELVDASRSLSREIVQRQEAMESLRAELDKAGSIKTELLGELAQIQGEQRQTFELVEASDDRLRQLDAFRKQIEQRWSNLEEVQHKLVRVESRLADLAHLSQDVDRKVSAVNGRAQVVEAVKREVEGIQALGLKCQADLAAIGEGRSRIAEVKDEMDHLLATIGETHDKIAAIENRHQLVDDVQRKTHAITHLLEDVRIALENLAEQKAMIDHVFTELARLEYVVHEARGTMTTLKAEREVAQRIAQNVRQIHDRSNGGEKSSAPPATDAVVTD